MESTSKENRSKKNASEDPLVSILAPCYNTAKYLQPFLDSVLQQTYRNIEFIAIDDGSTDETLALLLEARERFSEREILYKVLKRSQNGGAAAALNLGLAEFSGDYLMWVDSDDVLFKTNVEEKVCMLEEHPEFGFVLSEGIMINANARSKDTKLLRRRKPKGEDALFEDLILEKNVVFGPGTILARKEAFLRAIPNRRIAESPEGQNYQLILPLAYRERCCYLEKPLFMCIAHDDSHSRRTRSYEQLQARQHNFEALIAEIIDAIPRMNPKERSHWKQLSAAMRASERIELAFLYGQESDVRAELQNLTDLGYPIKPWQKRRSLWIIHHQASRVRNLMRKIIARLGINQ